MLKDKKAATECKEEKATISAIKNKLIGIQTDINNARKPDVQVIQKVEKASERVKETGQKAKEAVEKHAKAQRSEKATREHFSSTMSLLGSIY